MVANTGLAMLTRVIHMTGSSCAGAERSRAC
jgi:hypothetical protein